MVGTERGKKMGGLIVVFLIWCCFAAPVGWAIAKIESRVNNAPMRTKSAILWSCLGGPIGWIWLVMRSSMKFAGGIQRDLRAQGDAARAVLQQQQSQYPPPQQYPQSPYPPVQQVPPPAVQYPQQPAVQSPPYPPGPQYPPQ